MGEIRKDLSKSRSCEDLPEALVTSESPLSGLEGGDGGGTPLAGSAEKHKGEWLMGKQAGFSAMTDNTFC